MYDTYVTWLGKEVSHGYDFDDEFVIGVLTGFRVDWSPEVGTWHYVSINEVEYPLGMLKLFY